MRIPPSARLIEAATGATLGGADLTRRLAEVVAAADRLPPGVVFLRMPASLPAVVCYLGLLAAGRPVLPVDPAMPEPVLADLLTRFAPAALVSPAGTGPAAIDAPQRQGRGQARHYAQQSLAGWDECLIRRTAAAPVHPELGLLMATSGSTGAPKLVRLSTTGVLANARAVVAALAIDPADVAITALPLHYSYGLSVLTSHLLAGATVVCAAGNVTAGPFWQAVDQWQVSTLALVPSQYEMLARMRWRTQHHPSLRVMTVAGGRLSDELTCSFHAALAEHKARFYVMYGQTEAGPRICVLPPERLRDKIGSAGTALSGVRLRIASADNERDTEARPGGAVVCTGPGVMMGYAEHADDLATPDSQRGVLNTGDLGRLDADGFLWLSGRSSRIGKVFGIRIHLDAVERLLDGEAAAVAAVAGTDRVRIWCEAVAPERESQLVDLVATGLRLHRSGIELHLVARLPRLANGKTDYRQLERTP